MGVLAADEILRREGGLSYLFVSVQVPRKIREFVGCGIEVPI